MAGISRSARLSRRLLQISGCKSTLFLLMKETLVEGSHREACRRVETEAKLVVQFQLFACHLSFISFTRQKTESVFISQAILVNFLKLLFPQRDKSDFSGAIDADGQGAAEACVHDEGLAVLVIASPGLLEHPRGGSPTQ